MLLDFFFLSKEEKYKKKTTLRPFVAFQFILFSPPPYHRFVINPNRQSTLSINVQTTRLLNLRGRTETVMFSIRHSTLLRYAFFYSFIDEFRFKFK